MKSRHRSTFESSVNINGTFWLCE